MTVVQNINKDLIRFPEARGVFSSSSSGTSYELLTFLCSFQPYQIIFKSRCSLLSPMLTDLSPWQLRKRHAGWKRWKKLGRGPQVRIVISNHTGKCYFITWVYLKNLILTQGPLTSFYLLNFLILCVGLSVRHESSFLTLYTVIWQNNLDSRSSRAFNRITRALSADAQSHVNRSISGKLSKLHPLTKKAEERSWKAPENVSKRTFSLDHHNHMENVATTWVLFFPIDDTL